MTKQQLQDTGPMYRQCLLCRGNQAQITWLPKKFAKVGLTLKLKEGEAWEDGWKVLEAYAAKPESWVLSHERDWMRTRKNTDI